MVKRTKKGRKGKYVSSVRKFGDKDYYLEHSQSTKSLANKEAKNLRGKGWLVRVIPWKGPSRTWYAIYTRKKR